MSMNLNIPLNLNKVSLAVVAGVPAQFPQDPRPQIAFSGRSNVGKSSLINTLLGRKSLARVSGQPGKTITVNYYDIDSKLYFVDLPGYGYAKRSQQERERLATLGESYFSGGHTTLTLQLIDLKVGATEDDRMMLRYLEEKELPYMVVATKVDKLSKTSRAAALRAIPAAEESVLPFSSLTGEGREELWNVLCEFCLPSSAL